MYYPIYKYDISLANFRITDQSGSHRQVINLGVDRYIVIRLYDTIGYIDI